MHVQVALQPLANYWCFCSCVSFFCVNCSKSPVVLYIRIVSSRDSRFHAALMMVSIVLNGMMPRPGGRVDIPTPGFAELHWFSIPADIIKVVFQSREYVPSFKTLGCVCKRTIDGS